MSFLFDAREKAQLCSNLEYREALKTGCDLLHGALIDFRDDETVENMKTLNGRWALVERIIKAMPPEQPPAPIGGRPEATLLQIAA